MDFNVSVLLMSTLLLSAPLILAAMGGLTSERSGVINIGLEGKMVIACVMAAVVGMKTGNAMLGLLAAIAGAIVFSLIHFVLTQTYRIDQIVSGMAINALAFGASNVLDRKVIEGLDGSKLPHFSEFVFVGLGFIIPVLIWAYLKRAKGGLRLLAVGNDPDKARQMGVSPLQVRFFALIGTGVFCGLAGTLVVSSAGSFQDQMIAGRGYIALAALILGGWRPIPALIACLAFGFFDALQIQLQGTNIMGAAMPPEFWKALPYIATLAALAGLLGKTRAPSGLGKA